MERTPLNDWMTLVAAAALAAFTGMIAGAIFAGEAGTFREWVSALSGWVAGIGAVIVGVFTIRPLIRQVQVQEDAAKHALVVLAESTIERVHVARADLHADSSFARDSDRFVLRDTQQVSLDLTAISRQTHAVRLSTDRAQEALKARFIKEGQEFARAERQQAIQAILRVRSILVRLDVLCHIEAIDKRYTADEIVSEYIKQICDLSNAIDETDRRLGTYTLEVAKLL